MIQTGWCYNTRRTLQLVVKYKRMRIGRVRRSSRRRRRKERESKSCRVMTINRPQRSHRNIKCSILLAPFKYEFQKGSKGSIYNQRMCHWKRKPSILFPHPFGTFTFCCCCFTMWALSIFGAYQAQHQEISVPNSICISCEWYRVCVWEKAILSECCSVKHFETALETRFYCILCSLHATRHWNWCSWRLKLTLFLLHIHTHTYAHIRVDMFTRHAGMWKVAGVLIPSSQRKK